MNKFSVFLFIVGVCLTKAAQVDEAHGAVPQVPIVSQQSDALPDGTYSYSYEAEDGTIQEQKGSTKFVNGVPVLSIEGKYTYKDVEGVFHTITYIADETGYHPVGDLPVPPPVPALIAKSLNWIRSQLPAEEKK